VDQLARLLADCLDDLRVAMPGCDHGDPGVAVQKTVAVDVFNHRAFTASNNQRVAARIGWRQNCFIPGDYGLRLRTGQRADQMREVRADSS
jgi:hypothetical protein